MQDLNFETIGREFRLIDDSEQVPVIMFERRLEKGQVFHQRYLGCRECAADVRPPEGNETAIAETQDFGIMLWDIAFRSSNGKPDNRPIFCWARMTDGIIDVPEDEDAAYKSLRAYQSRKGAA